MILGEIVSASARDVSVDDDKAFPSCKLCIAMGALSDINIYGLMGMLGIGMTLSVLVIYAIGGGAMMLWIMS